MTGRQIIQHIANTCYDLDKDVPLKLLTRDKEGMAIIDSQTLVREYCIINGQINVEFKQV